MAKDIVPYEGAQAVQLVDAAGRPLRREAEIRAELERDVAGASIMGGRSIQTGRPSDGLTPERLARILRQAENGDATSYLELAEQMEEKDLHYLSVLGTRKRQVAQLPITVDAASDDPEDERDAQLVRDWLERDTLEAELFDILDAVGKGYSVTELIWDTGARPWVPVRLESRDQRWFEFDREDGRTLLMRTSSGPQALSPAKYIVHIHPAKTGLPIRGGLARPVAWAYLFRNFGFKDWLRFSEAYGLPLRVGKYESGTDDANVRKMLRSLVGMSADFAGAFPKSMDVEFIAAPAGGDELFQRLVVYFEQQISKAVLGQTSSADATAGGLGSGQATEHGEVRGDIERADAKLAATTLNRDLVPWMVAFNHGQRKRYPRIRIGRPENEDVKQFLESAEKATGWGVPIGVSHFRKVTGIPKPEEGEEVLKAPAPAPALDAKQPAALPAPGGKGPLSFLGPLKRPTEAETDESASARSGGALPPDEIDVAADEALADWETLIGPVTGPIEQLLAGASSLEDVRERLASAVGEMDVEELRERLARAAFAARLAGDADTPTDGG